MLERLKGVVGFFWHHPKDAAIIGLSLICIFLNWLVRLERKKAEQLSATVVTLPTDTRQVVTVYHDRVITKWRDGPEKVVYKERYLPPEGTVTLVTKEDPHAVPQVVVKDHGWTFRPGGGVLWSQRLLPCADAKFAYWRRYGLTSGVTKEFAMVGASRRMSDVTPFQNLEVSAGFGLDWTGGSRLAIGLRTNL